MNFTQLIGRLLGVRDLASVERLEVNLAAPWAAGSAFWLLLACVGLVGLAVVFYLRAQPARGRGARVLLTIARAALLCLILLFLAEPTIVAHLTTRPRPLVWLLFDGTDSMNIADDLPAAERAKLSQVADLPVNDATAGTPPPTRLEYLSGVVERRRDNIIAKLSEKYRLRAFQFDRPDAVRALTMGNDSAETIDTTALAAQLSANGQVSSIGGALVDLQQRHASSHLAGVVMFSDFDQNAGPPALAAARELHAPIYCVGIGPTATVDLSVDLRADLLMKKSERSTLSVTLRQSGLDGKPVNVRLLSRRASGMEDLMPRVVEQRSVLLAGPTMPVEFAHTPEETGRFVFSAEVDPIEGEVVRENNHAEREVNIRDDFLRLMFVEHEPSWEWRFIKEVFHRDQLVGLRGFRTFLRSADPKVRQSNELFLPTITPPRADFFANDVIFIGDMPSATLSTRFCERIKEFVGTFGGGLVILSGPNSGPGQFAQTPLADMLPVIVDPDTRVRDAREFVPRLSLLAGQFDFMRLGADDQENRRAWDNLGKLPWYQPVSRVHPLATVLLEHPTDTCVDGKTPQPLIAIRRFGRGEVVYLGWNETWRLRRLYGEKFYRQFWGQLIHRLGLSHALGAQKRFVVRTDRQQYQVDDPVHVTIEAYDEDFEPLTEEDLPERKLSGELWLPGHMAGGDVSSVNPQPTEGVEPLSIPQFRPGVFETRLTALTGGEHRLRVRDPVTNEYVEVNYQVTSLSAERRSAVRNVALQEQLAAATGGKTYTLADVDRLPQEIQGVEKTESSVEVQPLWNTWLGFLTVVGLMILEWTGRKLVHLP
jgi:hypothetical protein